jgi:hypothetical protein
MIANDYCSCDVEGFVSPVLDVMAKDYLYSWYLIHCGAGSGRHWKMGLGRIRPYFIE